MITRTLNTYRARAYKLDFKDGQATADLVGEVEFKGMSAPQSVIRKAFADSGNPVPRGCKFETEVVGEEKWGCTLEEFMAVAHPIFDGPEE